MFELQERMFKFNLTTNKEKKVGIDTTTMLIIGLVIAGLVIAFLYFRGDPEVESPRSQMDILEELLRQRGFKVLVPVVRDFEKYNEDRFLQELQRLMVPFAQDREFIHDWFAPILLANMGMIMTDRDLFNLFDANLRRTYGYRLKPIPHVEYGVRPEQKLVATSEEGDVCFREEREVSLQEGQKTFVPLVKEKLSE